MRRHDPQKDVLGTVGPLQLQQLKL